LPRAPAPARRPKATALHRRPLTSEDGGDRVPGPTSGRGDQMPLRAWRSGTRSPTVVVRGRHRSPDAPASHGVGFFLQGLTTSSRSGFGSASPTSTLASRPGPRRLPRGSFPIVLRTGVLPSWTSSLPQSPSGHALVLPAPKRQRRRTRRPFRPTTARRRQPTLARWSRSSLGPKASRPSRLQTPCSSHHRSCEGDLWL
jgi:hypothetical protein